MISWLRRVDAKLKGYRCYIALTAIVVFGLIDTWNQCCMIPGVPSWMCFVRIPPFVFTMLAALGIYYRNQAGKGGSK